jgi:hypothetical protein
MEYGDVAGALVTVTKLSQLGPVWLRACPRWITGLRTKVIMNADAKEQARKKQEGRKRELSRRRVSSARTSQCIKTIISGVSILQAGSRCRSGLPLSPPRKSQPMRVGVGINNSLRYPVSKMPPRCLLCTINSKYPLTKLPHIFLGSSRCITDE